MTVVDASAETEIEAAFAALAQENAGALLLNTDPLLLGKREQIVQLAGALQNSNDLFSTRVRRCRRPDELWTEYPQRLVAWISDGTFDLGVTKQKLNSPEIASR